MNNFLWHINCSISNIDGPSWFESLDFIPKVECNVKFIQNMGLMQVCQACI